ncbi:hypothetical protein ACFOUS_07095 [Deinococcus metalli]
MARVRLKGAAPQVYSGPSQQTQSSFPLWFWAVLLTIALVVFVVSHA